MGFSAKGYNANNEREPYRGYYFKEFYRIILRVIKGALLPYA
jgi:hypothetical protein